MKALEPEVAARRGRARRRSTRRCPNPPDPTRRRRGHRRCARWATRARRAAATTSSWPGALIDMEAGAQVAGSRFAYLKGDLVLLELALVRWALEVLRGHGFEPVIPPVLVREEALFGTGFLPDTEQQIYRLADDPLYLRARARCRWPRCTRARSSTSGCRCRYAGFSPCFRREAGAAGKRHARHLPRAPVRQGRDVLVRRAGRRRRPSTSGCWRSRRRSSRRSEIPYRVVNIAVDDLGALGGQEVRPRGLAARRQQRYREVTSTSNTTDFQARRLDIRYRPEGGRPAHVHTLNGTAVPWRAPDRAAGEPPARRRRGRDPAGPAGVGRACAPGLTSRARPTSATSAACRRGRRRHRPGRADALRQPAGADAGATSRGWSTSSACASSSICARARRSSSKGRARWWRDGRVEIRHRSLYPEKGQLTDVMISRADGEDPAVAVLPAATCATGRTRSSARWRTSRRARPGARALRGGQGPHGRRRRDGARRGRAWSARRSSPTTSATGERIAAIMARLRASPTYRRRPRGHHRRLAQAAPRVPRARARGARRARRRARRAGSRRTASTRLGCAPA